MRIAIASTQRLFLDGLVKLFTESTFHVVAAGTELRACVKSAHRERADLIVFDLHGATDSDVQFLLGAQSAGELRAIVITADGPAPEGFDVKVSRSDTSQTLLETAQTLGGGLPQSIAGGRGRPRTTIDGHPLAPREYDVATLIAKGFTNQKIAETMALREQNVKNLVSTVIRKLHCENRVQVALRLSRQLGTP